MIEDTTSIALYADLPGVPKDRLNVRVEGGTLLSCELDPDKVSAELSQGVLRLRFPEAEHAQPRRITVQLA